MFQTIFNFLLICKFVSSFKTRTEKIVWHTYMFQNVKEKNNNYFINPSCFVYDKSERLINKSCNLYQILGEITGILRNACTLSTENRHKTLHGFVFSYAYCHRYLEMKIQKAK